MHWRRAYFQKCKEAERSSCHSAAVPDRSGNGLPLYGTGAQSRQEKFFLEFAYVAEALAQIKGITAEEVIAVTEENAKRLLFRA